MKKTILLLFITLIVVSCDDTSKDIQSKSIDLKVNAGDWVENTDNAGLNRSYTCYFNMPEITPSIFNNGTVTSYIEFSNPNSQQNLPYVQHFQNSAGTLWTRTIDLDYSIGGLTIHVTNSDFALDPPNTMYFRVVLM